MSLLHCACSKSHISESPPAHKPYVRNAASPVSQYKVTVTMNSKGASCTEVVKMQFDIVASAYTLHAIVGHGHKGTATIHMAVHNPSSTQVAVKRINLEHWDQEFAYIQNEVVLTKQLQHDNILPHYCSFIHRHELWIVMPPMGFGSCRDLMHAYFTAGLPETTIVYVLRDVLRALEYLHDRGLIHRGIKGSHVLISGSGAVCLTGLHNTFTTLTGGQRIRTVHHFPEHAVDCLQWFSPEILEQNMAGYDTKSDIYSVGILACELANGQAPFTDMPVTQMLLEKINGTKPMLADSTTCGEFIIDDNNTDELNEEGRRKTAEEKAENIFFQRTFDPNLHNLVSMCLEKNPAHRPSASQLLNHPCFKSLRSSSTEVVPATLHPVTPLTNLPTMPTDSSVDEDMARQLSQVTMEEDWTF
ncbi:STE20-related kinase adapter protein alpha-like isoform X2 [Babylonia areolata]|uniref:STE20-related kinase adapter protein alpha-like isoform X2 n=1 Tax=Babylonia areolata TaxID=304850 RepID=UPI003FD51577